MEITEEAADQNVSCKGDGSTSAARVSSVLMEEPFVSYEQPDGVSEAGVGAGRLSLVQRQHGKYLLWRPYLSPPLAPLEEDSAAVGRACLETDIADLASLKVSSDQCRCVLVQRDGSRTGSLIFTNRCHTQRFLDTLHSVKPLQRSCRDSGLYLVGVEASGGLRTSPARRRSSPSRSAENALQGMWRLVRQLPHDPRTVALASLGKLADSFLNIGLEEDRPEEDLAELLRGGAGTVAVGAPPSPPPRLDTSQQEGFEVITEIRLGDEGTRPRAAPLTLEELQRDFLSESGHLTDEQGLLERVFLGGLEPSVRPLLWRHLLRCTPLPGSGQPPLFGSAEQRRCQYERMCSQWQSVTADQLSRFSALRERQAHIDKDVARTDRTLAFYAGDNNANLERLRRILYTYCMYNFDLGYVQGMSDLVSPILYVLDCEVDAFWCFVSFMDRLASNFELSQSCMRNHFADLHALLQVYDPAFCAYLDHDDLPALAFTFRWLLVWFKRELCWSDVLRLWEALWTRWPCDNMVLLVALAVLHQHRSTIMESRLDLTAIIKYVNDLALCIDLDSTLQTAERMWRQFGSGSRLPRRVRQILSLPDSGSDQDQEQSSSSEAGAGSRPCSSVDTSAVEATNDSCDLAMSLSLF